MMHFATTHGYSRTKQYHAWVAMRARCNNPSDAAYANYGGRGIKICDQWNEFASFLRDMGEQPAPRMQVDRIDNDGHYEPGNCRWVAAKTNLNNKRSNRFVEFSGKRQTIAQWAEEIGINYRTLNNRINRGWTVERALTTPARKDLT